MKKLLFVSGIILLHSMCFSQTFIFRGTVIDSASMQPVQGANIFIEGTTSGTVSDFSGNFSLRIHQSPCVLSISHISYSSTSITVKPNQTGHSTVLLSKSTKALQEFSVWAEQIRCINPEDQYFITDYRIMDGNILALAYKNRMFSRQYLIMFSTSGKKLSETEIKNNGGLYQDPDNYCYVVMNGSGHQIFYEDSMFSFSEAFDASIIDTARNTFAATREDTLLLKKYYYNNQILSYYSWENEKRNAEEFRTYINEEGIEMMSWGPFFDGNEFDNRFASQIFFKPIQAPVFVRDSEVLVFNCITGNIEHYSGLTGSMTNETEMKFINDKQWSGEFYYDPARDTFYTSFIRKSTTYIAEVNIETGITGNETKLSGYSHIENIRIYNGNLFFLYKQYYGDDYKRLYVSNLSSD